MLKRAGGANSSPNIVNIVATAHLSRTQLKLEEIAEKAKNSEYNPKRYSAIIMRIKEPSATALIFSTGKVVIMGAKSEEAAHAAARQFAQNITKAGTRVSLREIKIHNVVGRVDIGFKLHLDNLHVEHPAWSTYDPESFPGLTYRMQEPDVVLLIFHSGKIVLTKAK
ncbi:TATA box binding protein [Salpingoeca rosetta]|uniref:TATA box binding protein n=1 Tax=Salpingoeca rosetta (strain ATCC 50818 / BSB-021) TaxID=946362 RepID=F2UHQ8_SALR5|nr:TATA box binding protein [Salpingoeca rosetta]EGD76657.1 TATA box binding protein [Salpingoeca rosetta]|eukprot:XP_004991029.1 TATA box binding protein [Salpingoeca rosetta]